VTRRLNEWRNDQWGTTFEFLDPGDHSMWRMTKRVLRIPTPSPPLITPGGIPLSDSQKAEALADNLETQFQPVTNPSVPAVIEVVSVARRSSIMTTASKPNLTNPEEVQEAVRGLKISKVRDPNAFPSRVLRHIPQRSVSLLVKVFNAIHLTDHFPTVQKHARVISILKPGKDQALPSS